MSNEIILRDQLFRFLRPPDYITDVNHYLPKFLAKDPSFAETQRVLSWEHERYRLKIIDFAKQFHPQTATWGLTTWEEELGLSTPANTDMELRRAIVMAKLLGSAPMTVENTNRLVNLFTDDGKAYVEELPEPGTVKIIVPSNQVYLDELHNALDEMLPAHLVYYLQRIIIIGGDEDDEGATDDVGDINDDGKNSFLMHADFPIVENVPYGSWYRAPKYDGTVQIKGSGTFNDKLKYDGNKIFGGLVLDGTQYGNSCKWWFIPTGNSFYDREFQHNGAILYDGLKPQDIEYDDDMDELRILELTHVTEENLTSSNKFDGNPQYDGAAAADENDVPTDTGGTVEITRTNHYDGKALYNGGDVNYFNGAIRADGSFTFVGEGTKASAETLIDQISGKRDYYRKTKEKPLSRFYPEVFDAVPLTTEMQSAEISTEPFSDTVDAATDDPNTLTISRAVRYDGAKRYNAGNVNCFNGEIKADGNFAFVSNGNQAKIEVIAVDLDGSFSMEKIEKNIPPLYIENFDYVNTTYDETQTTAHLGFDDYPNADDGNGELIIRRRSRYDGHLFYQGYFEYPADARKRFNGNLNYNNVYRWAADGTIKYNGTERYGGRKNHTFIEYVSDLNGNPKIIDTSSLEKIPIATYTRLGYVIAGNNLDIDDRGKITLPERFKTLSATEIKTGMLKTIFENRSCKQ